jgi:hypothetical protein
MKLKYKLMDRVGFSVLILVYGVLIGIVSMLIIGIVTSDDYAEDKLEVHTQGLEITTQSIKELMVVIEKYGGSVDEVVWKSIGSDTIRIRFANWKEK